MTDEKPQDNSADAALELAGRCKTTGELSDLAQRAFWVVQQGAMCMRTGVLAFLHDGAVPKPTPSNPFPEADRMLREKTWGLTPSTGAVRRMEHDLLVVLELSKALDSAYMSLLMSLDEVTKKDSSTDPTA